MSRLDIVETGFSNLDETINFGSRAVGANSLYEVCTLAVIRSSQTEAACGPVKIISHYQKENIYFSIDNILRIMPVGQQIENIISIEVDHNILGLSVSTCGKFVLILTQDGEITIRTIVPSEDPEIVFKEKLQDYVHNNFLFTCVYDMDVMTFLLATSNGLVKKFRLSAESGTDVKFIVETLIDLKMNVHISCFKYPFLLLEGDALVVLDVDCKNYVIADAANFKTVHAIGSYFFGYDKNGNVYKIEPSKLLIFGVSDKLSNLFNNFYNIIFLDDGEKKSKLHLVGTTKNAADKNEIHLITYPGSEKVFAMCLDGPVHLINIQNLSHDVLFFTQIFKNDILLEIRLQTVTTADPEFRVNKLIQKQLFNEAEVFARTYNVSPEVVAEAKARHIVNKLICTTNDIDQLLEILNTINDPLFRFNCCDIVDCKFESDARRVLCYGASINIDVKDCSENKDNVLLIMKRSFTEKLYRFDTFMQIYDNYNFSKLKYFFDCNLIKEMKIYLKKNNINEASVILNRLDRRSIESLDEEQIIEILFMLKKDSMATFLSNFISTCLKHVLGSLPIIVKWVYITVYQLEKQCNAEFPENAILFVKQLTRQIDNVSLTYQIFMEKPYQELTHLYKALMDIEMLLNNFNIQFSLYTYVTEPFNIIGTLLTAHQSMSNLNFDELMKKFVCPFICKNNLSLDHILEKEIKSLLVYEEEYWIGFVEVIIGFINDVDKRLELIFKILEIASTPWSKTVKNVAQMTCQLAPNNFLATKITKTLEDEQIIIVLRKYNITKTKFELFDDKIFCLKRIIYLNQSSLYEDIHSLCVDAEILREANIILFNRLILKGNFEEAMHVIDSNKTEKDILCKSILDRFLYVCTAKVLPEKYLDYYCIALDLIWNRFDKKTCDKQYEHTYKVLSAIFGIKKYFNIQLQPKDFRNKEQLFNKVIQETLEQYGEDDPAKFNDIVFSCQKLAHYFAKSFVTVFMIFLGKIQELPLLLSTATHILNSCECPTVLLCASLAVFKYLNEKNNISSCDETFLDGCLNVSDNEYYFNGIQLATKLIVKAMMCAKPDDCLAVLELKRWIDCCFYLTSPNEQFKEYISRRFINSVIAIKSIFNRCCNKSESNLISSMKQLKYLGANMTENQDQIVNDEMERLTLDINVLLKEDHYFTAFNVLKAIQQDFLLEANFSKEIQSLFESVWLPKTLETVLSQRYINKILLLNLLLLCENYEKKISQYLNLYKRQPKKLVAITQVSLELFKFHEKVHGKEELLNILNLCKWWSKIKDKKLKYETFFTAKTETRLEALIAAKQLNLGTLPKYCTDFNLDLQKSYLKYLEISLKLWEPQIKEVVGTNGKTDIVILNDENELEQECLSTIKYITKIEDVFSLIEEIWPLINFYYYEVFMVLLAIQCKLPQTKKILFEAYRPLLLFLKSYKRVSNPSRSEEEQWFGTFPLKDTIEPLSKIRLPLADTFFSNKIWTIIKPEVNLDTYKSWFKVTPILKNYLSIDDICSYAINSALPVAFADSTCNTWKIYPSCEHLIAKVEECAKNITDLQQATAAVYALMGQMPHGIDKVKLAELSYNFAQIYHKKSVSDEKVEKVFTKVKQRYFNYSTTHILHKYELAEEDYLKLVTQPLVLISELYDNSRILKTNCPDINKAVDEICNLFGLAAKKVKYEVLLNILKFNSALEINETINENYVEDTDAETNSILRACYICEGTDFHKTLLKMGMNKSDAETNLFLRYKALKCVYYTTNVEFIEAKTGMNEKQFSDFMKKISVIAKLKHLGIKFTDVEHLDQFNKKKLLKDLASMDKPLAITCISSICRIYNFDDIKYWEFIVNTAIKFHMINALHEYVEHLRFRCVTDFIKKAWFVILCDAFSPDICTIESYIKAVRLLQSCPVIYDISVEDLVKKCIVNKRIEIAAVLLQYLPLEKLETYSKNVYTLLSDKMLADIAELKKEGVLGIDKILNILDKYKK